MRDVPKSDQEYCDQHGEQCPYCDSDSVVYTRTGPKLGEPAIAEIEVMCHDCGNDWMETYILTGWR